MILLFHIVIALSSLVSTGLAFFYPSRAKLQVSYALVAMTLFTGFYLVISKPAHMTQTCAEGLVYLAVVAFGIISARHKLATVKS